MGFHPIKSLKEFFGGSSRERVSLGLSTAVAPLGTVSDAAPQAPVQPPAAPKSP